MINHQAHALCDQLESALNVLRIARHTLPSGTRVFDFGVEVSGSLTAGIQLARICMGDAGKVDVVPANRSLASGPQIQVMSDAPVTACLLAQYAGWPVQHERFFAMGSGPMRIKRGREPVLDSLQGSDPDALAVGVLECDMLPSDLVCQHIAEECHVSPEQLTLCVAPTRSLAGTLQVVARSIETSLHKLYELQFDVRKIVSGYGIAPLPPPAKDFINGIGRTNDAILYGGQVTLWVDCDDALLLELGPQVPSQSSQDWGEPFATIFKRYDCDFYRVEKGLFAPAEIVFVNLKTGNSFRFGTLRPDCIQLSFAERE